MRATRDVLGAVDQADSSEGALGAISYALPGAGGGPWGAAGPEEEAEADESAAAEVAELLATLEWQAPDTSPHVLGLTAGAERSCGDWTPGTARASSPPTRRWPSRWPGWTWSGRSVSRTPVALAERAVIVFAICAPVFELLRRLAQENQVRRRVAGADGDSTPPR
ncbi:hypothetical protein ACFSNO_15830 [Streptomyces cirratus]